ncbi:hypothetical protein PVAND_016702 [Polypedilum vanderplanki]|uniref:Hyaluronan/mRNA-binding protein domain-containing protein n=1 Tax=Polypedilum vanderplanki TaxID=319348 RepID=A0A9J6BGJ4_POLVA|nr:hypothetical protein PVAND_016702 [Polypedilum vanderplanki]
MENSYGIGIANRYDLFYGQDDAADSFETAKPQPQQQQLKAQPQKDQKRGIKEQNNTGIGKKDDKQITQNGQPRQNFAQRPAAGGENREERNNRKNREMNGNGQLANGIDGQNQTDRPRTGNNQNRNRRNFDGKRRDRQSGSDKTGVKAVDKRDGAGAHNWGSHKQDIEDMNKPATDGEDTSGEKEGDEVVEETPAPEEPKEMTLDEWKAQRQAQMLQPQYNLRKAGEGENNKWDNMVQLDKKLDESIPMKKDENRGTQEGKKKQVLDIDFHFNDGRRGGLGRRGPGNAGGERGPGNAGRQQQNRRRPPRENNNGAPREGGEEGGNANGPRPERRQRRPRFQRSEQEGQNAPKVDDERDFPSLG